MISAVLKGLWRGTKAVAAGKTQASLGVQSPHLPSAIVRVGRFLYSVSIGWIAVAWYTGFVNARTQPGSGPQLILGGKVIGSVDRPDKTPNIPTIGHGTAADNQPNQSGFVPQTPEQAGRKLVAITPAQLGTPGLAGYLWSSPKKDAPGFDRNRYNGLLNIANILARQYGLKITSGYRPQSSGSLHASGLAFDFVGSMSAMKRADVWAANNPALFQEVFIHNAGSGLHLHLGFYPDAAGIWNAATNKYTRPSQTAASPAATHIAQAR